MKTDQRPKGRKKRLLYAPVAVILFFCLCEILLLASGFQYDLFRESISWQPRAAESIIMADPHLFWRLRPAHNAHLKNTDEDYQIVNSLGFRGDEFERQKVANEYRIIAVGDSCTFGDGVSMRESYPALLEGMLDTVMPGLKIRVINAGVPGYSSFQVLHYLNRELIDLAPDLVTVYVGFNDAIHAANGIPDSRRRFSPIRIAAARLRVVQLLEYLIHKPLPAFLGAIQNPAHPPAFRVPSNEFIANLIAIHELGKNHNFDILLMTLPHQGEKQPERNAQILEACGLSGSPCIDLFGIMKKHQADGEKLYFPDGGHPNALGHQRIAEKLGIEIKGIYAKRT